MCTTPSTSSTPGGRTRGYALECLRAAVAAGAENVTLCDTNGSSLPPQVAEATAAVVAELGEPRREIGIHTHNDAECGGRELARRRRSGRSGSSREHERLWGANRQREPGLDPARAAAEAGLRVRAAGAAARLTETSHFIDELCNLTPDPDRPYVGRNAFAHKGGMHVAGVKADASTFEHIDPSWSATAGMS